MVYGLGSRSYNRSRENRENKKAVAEQTAKFERGEMKREVVTILLCHCRSFNGPHSPEKHKELPFGDLDWRTPSERSSSRVWNDRIR